MKQKLSNFFTLVLILSAVLISSLVIKKSIIKEKSKELVTREIPEWKDLKLNGYRLGDDNAKIQIIEFFDYECSYCLEVNENISELLSRYPKDISIVFEHFPLDGHDYAVKAAISSECARNQGRFFNFHNKLFQNQKKLNALNYDSLAVLIGIENLNEFNNCRVNRKPLTTITSGIRLAENLGIGGVPTFIINGKVVPGAISISEFEEIIDREL